MAKWIATLVVLWAQMALGAIWTLTSADFQQRDGTLEYVSPAGVGLKQATLHELPWAQIVALDQRGVRSIRTNDAFVLYTRDGQRLMGTPLAIADDKLSWQGAMVGEMRISLEQIRSLGRAGAAMPADAAKEDQVVLQNGDVLSGIVDGGEKGIMVQRGAASTPVAWDAVRSVSLAQIGESKPAASSLRIRLADGSVCIADTVHLDREELHIVRPDADELKLPLRVVQSLQNERGRVHFLAWLTPEARQYVPYTSFTSDGGGAMKVLDEVALAGRSYRNVIQLRPKSAVTYRAPVTGTLHLQYACGNAGRFTDMTLKMTVAGKIVADMPTIRAIRPTGVADAPVNEGDEIRIEVGYGANYDVQDFLWLVDAAFIGAGIAAD